MALNVRVVFVPQLVRDLACFGFDQRRRQVKADQLVQLVQQTALHDSARTHRHIPLPDALRYLGFQRSQIFGTEFLGQFVVHLSRQQAFSLL